MGLFKKNGSLFNKFFTLDRNSQMGYVLLAFVCSVIIGTATALFISLEYPLGNIVVDNDWIGFYGNLFGGLLGVLITLFIFRLKRENEQDKKKERLELYLNQYKHYLWKIEYKVDILLKEVKESLENVTHNEDNAITYFKINTKDFSDILIDLEINDIISNDFVNNSRKLEINLEIYNQIKRELLYIKKLNESEILEKYNFKGKSKIPNGLQEMILLEKKYNHIKNILEKIKNNIETIYKLIKNKE